MAIGSTALSNVIIILIIGAVVGLAFSRYARSWLACLGSTARSDITASLVGIAGVFHWLPHQRHPRAASLAAHALRPGRVRGGNCTLALAGTLTLLAQLFGLAYEGWRRPKRTRIVEPAI
jgi:hypothetical protein